MTTTTFGTATKRTATITEITWPEVVTAGRGGVRTIAVVVTDDGLTAQTRPGRGSLFSCADIGAVRVIEELNGYIVYADIP
jgi:hypothetical protein